MVQLQPHQQATLDWFLKSQNRGLLILHGTGSGKSLTAIAIAEHLKKYKECVLIAPKSLHDNFKKELERYGSKVDVSRYKFVSSNASNMIDKLETTTDELTGVDIKSLRLDNKLILIDEAHNLLVGMANGSKNATALYDLLMKAKDCRIVMLTASGIINNIFEIVPALNICKGPIKTEDGEWTTLLPESSEDFSRYFIDEKEMKLKNINKLQNRIAGLVSYKGDLFERKVLSFYPMLNTKIVKEHYPDRLPLKLIPIHMSNQQYGAYEQAREKERLETRNAIVGSGVGKGKRIILSKYVDIKGGELKKSSIFGKSTSYRIKSRQISNVYQPEGIDLNDNIEIYSPKIYSIGKKIKAGVKTLIYSNFVQAGITPMASYLEHIGYKRYNPNNKSEEGIHGCYGIYSGEVSPEDRTATLQEYNKPNSPLTILLISSSGAEGLSTKGTRIVHILEPYWNFERSLQVMARGIRYKSHEHLPEKERNVQVYIYLAVAPKDVKTIEKTTDLYLFTSAASKYEINQEMIKLMASVSVECTQFNEKINFDCYTCEPKNSAPLYVNDLNKDMEYPLPCKNDTKPLDANEIKLNGSLYYLTEDKRLFTQSKEGEYNEIIDKDIKDWILNRVLISA